MRTYATWAAAYGRAFPLYVAVIAVKAAPGLTVAARYGTEKAVRAWVASQPNPAAYIVRNYY